MRGVGGPLLCIGDLLSDVADVEDGGDRDGGDSSPPSSPTLISSDPISPSDLHHIFEENYNQLIGSLEATDHSWTALTLKLCAALKKADKLVNTADSYIGSLLEKVGELQSVMERGDSAVATAKAIQSLQINNKEPTT